MRVDFGSRHSINRRGEHGTSVRVAMDSDDGGWAGHYHFDTYGMTPGQVVAKTQQLRAHHMKKCKRLDGFVALSGVEFVISLRVFRILGATVRERAEEIELEVSAREVGQTETIWYVRRFATIDDVHDNGTIISNINAMLQQRVAVEQAHATFLSQVQALVSAQVPNVP